ncbi:MAG: Na/Pi cotransporter family protein [Thermodesulfobacteriota bacterium]|nr:Na/Pi cotransporter family protein [Thermodesulfobacteriota bacterium]
MKQRIGKEFLDRPVLAGLAAPVFASLLIPVTCFAASPGPPQDAISWSFIIIGLLGGLALFLYGLEKMSKGLKDSAGSQMRRILGALTRNRVIGFLVGGFVTMVIQSSSATTVMLVSFVQAGLMTFVQSLAVILGADVGTTVTAQLIAFKLTDYALLMVAAGFGARMFSRRRVVVAVGEVMMGFGILFYGMKLMSDAMAPLRTYPEFLELLQGLENPLMGILAGAAFTALIQSSSAFTGIVIVLAQENLITLEAGIPLVLGANIGTCITAVLASIGMTREAKRVALGHVLFKVAGVLLFVFWIPGFAVMVRDLTTHFGAGTARQIANAHTLFNVSVGLVFLPFTTTFALLIQRLLPDKKRDRITRELTTWYLDETSIKTPEVAISLARAELSRMAKLLERMLRAIIIPFISDEQYVTKGVKEKDEIELWRREIPKRDAIFPELTLMEGIDMREAKIDFLEEKISDFLNRVLREGVSKESVSEVFGMMSIAKDMESIGDLIHRNMVPLIAKKKALHADFSDEGKEELMIYHNKVCAHIRLLKEAFAETNRDKACQIMSQERTYLDLESKFRLRHLERVHCEKPESRATHEIHMELMDLLKQIVVYSSNIASTFSTTCAIARPPAAASAEPAPLPGAIFQEGPARP